MEMQNAFLLSVSIGLHLWQLFFVLVRNEPENFSGFSLRRGAFRLMLWNRLSIPSFRWIHPSGIAVSI